MSDKSPNPTQNEEVDLGQLFNAIGKMFDRFFKFIGNIFKGILSVVVYVTKVVLSNFKLISISVLLAAIIGYGLEKTRKSVYFSQMLVKPYFDSKYQLITNINYYNALIADQDYKQLNQIFGVNEDEAKQLIDFEIKPGPENENDRIRLYDRFKRSLDSLTLAEEKVTFNSFVENRSLHSGEIFEINVKSHKKDIFRSLEEGLNSTFSNAYSAKKMKKRDSILKIEKQRILKSLKSVDSLKRIYVEIKKNESNSNNKTFSTQDGLTYVEQRSITKEYELLEKENLLRQQLSALNAQKVEEDEFFDTLSSFQEVGAKYQGLLETYRLVFPALVLVFLILGFLIKQTIHFVKNYDN